MIFRHEDEALKWDHFPPSPRLSTFSVNILVSDLISFDPKYIEASEGKRIYLSLVLNILQNVLCTDT